MSSPFLHPGGSPADGVTLNEAETQPPSRDEINTHVDVDRAEQEFNALSRQLTIRSDGGGENNKWKAASVKDVEKGACEETNEESRFDLREYLSSSNDANQNAGIKHKVCL